MIQLAAKHGMTVLLDPIETGGWTKVLQANGNDKAHNFGRYLGQRYAAFPNIVWMSGNDFQTWRDTGDDALALAVAQGIRNADSANMSTVELDYYLSASLDDASWAPIIQLDSAYTYRPTYAEVLREYNRPRPLPVLMVEASYELEHDYTGPQTLRRQEYWSLLSGASAGQLYGNKYTWPFADGWQTHMDTVGSVQMSYVTSLFASLRWYDLVPDQEHTLVTAGYGTFTDSGNVNDSDYVTAARTADGAQAIAYVPSGRTITVDLSTMAGPAVQARWYDPSSGTFSSIGGVPSGNARTQQFQTPGRNGDGDSDWVLVLETTSGS